MQAELRDHRQRMRDFAASEIAPHAAAIDATERIPESVLAACAKAGLFASGLPGEYAGAATGDPVADTLRHGSMHEALGGASASVQGIVNVHHMAASAIARWGTSAQKAQWLPALAAGERRAALAISEPHVGSDAAAVETHARREGAGWRVDGCKTWITAGQSADVFVLVAGSDDGTLALLLPRDAEGLRIAPISGMLGCRGYMLATLTLDGCRLPADHLIGRAPFGVSHVAATALDAGRYNLAWGCVGLARACCDAALERAMSRRQFGAAIAEFELVQRMLSRMLTELEAARLMCEHAGRLRGARDPNAIRQTLMAKYFASQFAGRAASDAVQIHGAQGCSADLPLARHLRDARIMEIVEGTSQILETAIARTALRERAA
jgi:alkylation response protein AidB-like acyl-CoA dehydrogenase